PLSGSGGKDRRVVAADVRAFHLRGGRVARVIGQDGVLECLDGNGALAEGALGHGRRHGGGEGQADVVQPASRHGGRIGQEAPEEGGHDIARLGGKLGREGDEGAGWTDQHPVPETAWGWDAPARQLCQAAVGDGGGAAAYREQRGGGGGEQPGDQRHGGIPLHEGALLEVLARAAVTDGGRGDRAAQPAGRRGEERGTTPDARPVQLEHGQRRLGAAGQQVAVAGYGEIGKPIVWNGDRRSYGKRGAGCADHGVYLGRPIRRAGWADTHRDIEPTRNRIESQGTGCAVGKEIRRYGGGVAVQLPLAAERPGYPQVIWPHRIKGRGYCLDMSYWGELAVHPGLSGTKGLNEECANGTVTNNHHRYDMAGIEGINNNGAKHAALFVRPIWLIGQGPCLPIGGGSDDNEIDVRIERATLFPANRNPVQHPRRGPRTSKTGQYAA